MADLRFKKKLKQKENFWNNKYLFTSLKENDDKQKSRKKKNLMQKD